MDIFEKLRSGADDFRRSGYDVETMIVNALEKESVRAFAQKAAALGPVMYFIDTAKTTGILSPTIWQARGLARFFFLAQIVCLYRIFVVSLCS